MPAPSTAPNLTAPVVLSIGRLERYKGHHRLVDAWPVVLRHRPSARLRILGVGPYESDLRRQVEAMGLNSSVQIASVPAGHPQAMSDALGSASLVVLLSDYEAHPVAIMEALAVNRAVLVTETSGLNEIVAAGLARGVSSNAGPEQVAQAVLGQLQAPLTVDAGALATWDDCAAQLHDLYLSVVS